MTAPGENMLLPKGIFQAALMRNEPDLVPLTAMNVAKFHQSLERFLKDHTFNNVEFSESVAWILTHIAPSSHRSETLGKYLVKLSRALSTTSDDGLGNVTYSGTPDPRRAGTAAPVGPSPAWYLTTDPRSEMDTGTCEGRLRVLFVVDGVLQCSVPKSRSEPLAQPLQSLGFAPAIYPHVMDLVKVAIPTSGKHALEAHQTVKRLIDGWKAESVYDTSDIFKMRKPTKEAYRNWLQWLKDDQPKAYHSLQKRYKANSTSSSTHHGHARDPWHLLPAATMMPLIKGRKPISVAMMQPLALPEGPVDTELLAAVSDHIAAVNKSFQIPTKPSYASQRDMKLNGLGLPLVLDPITSKRKIIETYYGYSPKLAEELKRRKRNPPKLEQYRPKADTAARRPQSQTAAHPPPPPPPAAAPQSLPAPIPPPPPPMTAGGSSLPPLPWNFPPRPPDWSGPWPPPPPPGMMVPPPPLSTNMTALPPPPPPPSFMPPIDTSYGPQDHWRDAHSRDRQPHRGSWGDDDRGGQEYRQPPSRDYARQDDYARRGDHGGRWDDHRGRGYGGGRGRGGHR